MNSPIKIPCGNTLALQIKVFSCDLPYIMDENERIVFTVKVSAVSQCVPVIRKVLTIDDCIEDGVLQLLLSSADTHIQPGTYKYDCALHSEGEFYTIAGPADFIVTGIVGKPCRKKV